MDQLTVGSLCLPPTSQNNLANMEDGSTQHPSNNDAEGGGDDAMQQDQKQDIAAAAPSRIIEVPLQTSELLEINLDELGGEDSIADVVELFVAERTPVHFWINVLDEYAVRRGRVDIAEKLGEAGVAAFKERGDDRSTIPLLCMMASYHMHHSRSAPKTVLQKPKLYTVKGQPKQFHYNKATTLVTQAEAIDNRNGYVLDTKGAWVTGRAKGRLYRQR